MRAIYKDYCTEEFDDKGMLTGFSLKCPDDFNYAYDVVDRIASEEPEKTAMVWCDIHGNERVFSFGEMSELSCKAANYFISRGIRRGDRVMLILKRHYEYWYTILALHRIGAVAIPATYMLTEKDIVYRVNNASIRAVVCADDENIIKHIKSSVGQCPSLEQLYTVRCDYPGFDRLDSGMEKMSEVCPRIKNKTTDPFIMYFTSGTTGYPKAVIHDYSYPLSHICTAVHWQNVVDGGLHLTVADTGWGKASWGKIYGQWLAGSAVMVYDFEKFDADGLMNVISKYHVTTFCAPPTIYRFLVKNGLEKYDLSSLVYATTAGEALNYEIMKKFEEVTHIKLMEGYGQTETVLIIANLYGSSPRAGALGKPTPMFDIKIVDTDGNELPAGEVGEIVVKPCKNGRQYGIFSGYDNDDKLYEYAWRGGVYHTGDTAYADEDGYIWYVGRIDDIIKSSGYRIGPFEIESVLIAHPAVLECAVTGVPDPDRGCVVKATVVLRDGYEPSDALAKELQTFVKDATAPYKYPRIVSFVSELPKTISGKIRHAEIRKKDMEK